MEAVGWLPGLAAAEAVGQRSIVTYSLATGHLYTQALKLYRLLLTHCPVSAASQMMNDIKTGRAGSCSALGQLTQAFSTHADTLVTYRPIAT